MKIVAISDTHNRHKHLTSKGMGEILPEGDLLIHGGDLTGQGYKGEVLDIFKWFKEIADRYTYGIVFIAGNHDKSFDPKFNLESQDNTQKPLWLQEALNELPSGIQYLENESITIDGLKIWGSPITPWFYGDRWAFNKRRGFDIAEVWDQIPIDTDIIVTHGPAYGILDYTSYDKLYVGCENLRYKIKALKPKAHIFGHIHEGYGMNYDSDTTYYNASICTLGYEPKNLPHTINLEDDKI
jgi:Icc-related predicted phosphoesterase